MAKKKDFGEMERGRVAGPGAAMARDAMRTRLATPPSKLPLDQLQANPLNPRDHSRDEGIEELAETMRRHGQLQQAQVIAREDFLRAFPDTAEELTPAPWVVFIGNRRLLAAGLAGLDTLDVRAPEGIGTPEEIESRVLIENLQRSDLPLLKEAEFLQRQVNRGQSLRKLAAEIGKSLGYVQQRVGLLHLIPELQDLLQQGELSFKSARGLYPLTAEEQAAIYRSGPPWSIASGNPQSTGAPAQVSEPGGAADKPTDSDQLRGRGEATAVPPGAEAKTPSPSATSPSRRSREQPAKDGTAEGGASSEGAENVRLAALAKSVSIVLGEVQQARSSAGDESVLHTLREVEQHMESALAGLREL
ncbi:Chromosome (plasmid) partitioning protein ParB / Stage 0 sporulation protein J [Pseudonocardia sp. Ae717_Ps2]|uniref:ParB/RepB/Spo0J family partition protein n=1 Tax=Pseudonocardia sp. Ae717_Ps2 TaxID=1885573 RepID=UPI00094B18D2|nr:ParB/RepB/Spo0J family partition protein [Pseudonocardia sp. Ae717_Ps2]OLM28592.1 Chromosome (plasmid) partitioning protein ParB / Stage 0 sporulation protein J [Pseudonocardia sp. Ae717_Ps2]